MRRAAARLLLTCGVVLLAARGGEAFVWPSAAERAARALASSDVAERRSAAGELGEMPESVAAPLLMQALADTDVEVRLRAAKSAIRLRSVAAVQAVLAWLSDGDPRVRLAACELVRYVPSPRAVASLGRVLGDPDAAVRLSAASAMGASGAAEAVGPLLGHLDDPSPNVRAEVAQALARIGDLRAAVPLVGRVGDSAPEVRRAVVRALGELGDPRAASALVLSLRDSVAQVRVEALGALGRLRAQDAVLAIAPLIEERGTPEVRVAALVALGKIGSETAIRALIKALASDDTGAPTSPVRSALEACGERATGPLLAAIESYGQSNVTAGAALVLGSTRAAGAGPVIVRAMRQGSLPSYEGLRALADLGDPTTLPTVLEMFSDPNPTVRHEAVVAAIALLDPAEHDGRAVEPLVAALRDTRTSSEERELFARALGRTGAPRALEVLLPLVAARGLGLRLAALDALGAMGPAGQDAVLMSALDDENASVRLHAALALAASASEASVARLVERLIQAAADDRTAVGIALSGTLSRGSDASVRALGPALALASSAVRDALIEGIGRAPGDKAGELLASVASTAVQPADKRKAAEALAGHSEQGAAMKAFLVDTEPSVRAQAIWSAGLLPDGPLAAWAFPRAAELLGDTDTDVAANAAAAVAMLARTMSRGEGGAATGEAAKVLCRALADFRPYVRANALAGLFHVGARCGKGEAERRLLLLDRTDIVRRAAARLLWQARRADEPTPVDDARALLRCVSDDKSGRVVQACRAQARVSSGVKPVLVFVVPDGKSAPLPLAPYALQRADGFIRSGVADRRGAVFERAAPAGELSLLVPGALAF